MLLPASWPISLLRLEQMRDYGNAMEVRKSSVTHLSEAQESLQVVSNEAHCDTDTTENGKQADLCCPDDLFWFLSRISPVKAETLAESLLSG